MDDVENIPQSISWLNYQQMAQSEMVFTDNVAIRCMKAGVPFTFDWQAYVTSLRAILAASNGDVTQSFPSRPTSYPEGS